MRAPQLSRTWLEVVAIGLFIDVSYGTLSYASSVLITEDAAGGEFGTGALAAVFGLAALVSGVMALVAGSFADLVGTRRLLVAGASLGAAGLALFAACEELWQVALVMTLLIGPAMAFSFYEPVYVLMNRWFEAPARPRAYGVLTFVGGLSITIFTPATSYLVEALGWREAVMVLATILLSAGWLIPPLLREPRPAHPARRLDLGGLLRATTAGLGYRNRAFWSFTLLFFAANAAFRGFSFHAIAALEDRGFDGPTVATVIAAAGLISLPTRLLLPAMSERWPSPVVLGLCLSGLGLAALVVTVATDWWHVWLYVIAFGAVFGAIYPLRALVTSELFSPELYGRLLGTQALFVAISGAAGPALIGLYVRDGSYETAFRFSAAVLLVTAIAVQFALRQPASDRMATRPGKPASSSSQ